MDNLFKKQRILEGLSPVGERRRGKKINILYYMVVCMTAMGCSIYFLAGLGLPALINVPLVMLSLLYLPLTIFLTTREVNLVTQNYAADIASGMKDYLFGDEEVLVVLTGRAYSVKVPTWINDDIYSGVLFLFTSHRLILTTLKFSRIGIGGSLEKIILQDDFKSAINTVHSCDYSDRESCSLSSIFPNLLACVAYSKLRTKPVGEEDSFTWAISNRATAAGRMSTDIMEKFKPGFSA